MKIPHSSRSPGRAFSNRLISWIVASVLVLSSGQNQAGTSDPGIAQTVLLILSPILLITAPIFKGIELLTGSDDQARKDAEIKAKSLLATHSEIPVRGIYVGSISLRYGLYGMLVERNLPLVEISIAGSKWLFDLAENQQALAARAEGNKYVRLSLAPPNDPECFLWKSNSENWLRGPPVKPGTCLRVSFHNNIVSDIGLRVNIESIGKRELRWELTRIKDERILLSVPFWTPQFEGYPINFDVRYRHDGDVSAFSELIKKLIPSVPKLNVDGSSYVLNWVRPRKIEILPVSEYKKTTAAVRLSSETWSAADEKSTWELGYRHAQESQRPTVVNNKFIILPKTEQVYVNYDEFVKLYATECCLFSIKPMPNLNRGVEITGRRFTGKEFWHVNIKPDSHPEDVAWCTNSPENCFFAIENFKVSDSELVISGRYSRGSPHGEKYLWVIPLSSLPPW